MSTTTNGTVSRTFKFSHRGIDALPAPPADWPSSNIEYTDAAESGLRIAVYKTGKKSFRHRFTFFGRKRLMTLGEYPAVSVEKARERVRANKALLAEDLDPLEERDRQRAAITFAEFVEEHYLPFAHKERRSVRDIENRIKLRLLPAFGTRQLPRITKRDVSALHRAIYDEVSATSANRYLATLSGMFTQAIEWGFLTENPARGIRKFTEGGARDRVLNSGEIERFARALHKVMHLPQGRAIYLLLTMGLRKSEVLSMRWSNVDFERRSVYIPIESSKTKTARSTAMNSAAYDILSKMYRERTSESDWVFPSASKSGHLQEVRKTFTRITQEAGIEGLRLHDLRRSFASILINQGVSIYEVRDLLGHRDVRTTQIYARLGTQTLQKASEVAATELEKALSQG
jgi:integrase